MGWMGVFVLLLSSLHRVIELLFVVADMFLRDGNRGVQIELLSGVIGILSWA